MRPEEPNPRLERVRFQLRADCLPPEPPHPLRSGIHNRGYLPHVKREGASYFVTFRLADSLPKDVLLCIHAEKATRLRALETRQSHGLTGAEAGNPLDTIEDIEREHRRKIERYLDQGVGACHLSCPAIGELTAEALRHFDGRQYLLDEWVVMPNHVHLVLWPMPNFTLSQILKSRKQFIGTRANRFLGTAGQPFWQPESFDHWIRNDAEKTRIRNYIRLNPVKAGLCAKPEQWRWSSAWPGTPAAASCGEDGPVC